ncbi:MAG: septum site-determining protein MinD [Christensenellales bacterium]
MARKIVITSGKGGVGKTTICANLGARLASLGFRVCLMDVDIGLNNLDVVMGIEKKVMFDIIDVIEGRCRAKQALVQDHRIQSLYIMPSAHSYSASNVTGDKIKEVIDSLDSNFDYILIDCPAGVEAGFHRAVYSANEAIIVVTPHISSVRDADKVLSILAGYDLVHKSIIINRIRGDLVLSGEMLSAEEIVRALKTKLLGIIPEDDDITALSTVGGLASGNVAGRAFTILCENLHEGTRKIYDYTMRYRGVFGNFRRNLKRKI